MRTCIYTIAVGKWHAAYVPMLVTTLRKFGKYQGEFVAFTDSPELMPEGIDIRPIPNCVGPEFANFVPITLYKLSLSKTLFGEFDQYLFLDADHLIADELSDILNSDKRMFATEPCLVTDNKCHNGFLTDAETKYCKENKVKAINSGMAYCPDDRTFKELIEDWDEVCQTVSTYNPQSTPSCIDQAALNAAILRSPTPYLLLNEGRSVWGQRFKPDVHTQVQLLHFYGGKKNITEVYEYLMNR